MSRAPIPRLTRLAALLAALAAPGCTHYHYYGQAAPFYGQSVNVCDPVPQGATVISGTPVTVAPQRVVTVAPETVVAAPRGSICDVPSEEIVVGPTSPSTPVTATSPRVVATAPSSRSRYSWRRPDPESLATTRISGGVQSSQVR